MIQSLDQLVDRVKDGKRKFRIAVCWAQDPNTLGAIALAVDAGFIEAQLIGNIDAINNVAASLGILLDSFTLIEAEDQQKAAYVAVKMVRDGSSDILMKGLIGTDIFLKSIMDKESGLMLPGAVMSYVCAVDIPSYHKLLFITDTAVLPFPNLEQKKAMANYAITMANSFGIDKPRLALIGASEKLSKHFPSSTEYPALCKMVESGEIKDCIMDGPLDLFLACDKEACEIKGVDTPIEGNADILLFPSLESCNPFYKGLMQFAGGELAGMLTGTSHPVVLMSRSESELSKYYCIALSCLMVK